MCLPGNTTLFDAPISTPNLPNSIDVAGDITQYIHSVSIVGTEFGAANEGDALPASLTIVDPSYLCRPGTYPTGTSEPPDCSILLQHYVSFSLCRSQ